MKTASSFKNVHILIYAGCLFIIHILNNYLSLVLPGYGILPYVTISVRRIPKDHTSDLMLKVPKLMASGAVHLMGNLAPVFTQEEVKNKQQKKPLSVKF